jgi:mono/diheme cytochrome c family protein
MSQLYIRFLCCAALLCSGAGLSVADNHPAVTTFLETHCIDCHGADGEGETDLQLLASGQEQSPELIELVHHVIERHEMPPEEMEQPTKDTRQMVADELYKLLAEKTRQTLPPRSNRFVG